jgi:hypothetical protein
MYADYGLRASPKPAVPTRWHLTATSATGSSSAFQNSNQPGLMGRPYPDFQKRIDISMNHSILQSIFDLASKRNEPSIIREEPTVPSPSAIQDALRSLPSTLPSQGLGEEGTIGKVLQWLVPALATGQAGPR